MRQTIVFSEEESKTFLNPPIGGVIFTLKTNPTIKYQAIKCANTFFFVARNFKDAENRLWKFHAHGNYNAIYVHFDPNDTNPSAEPILVFAQCLDPLELTDSADRKAAVWNDVFREEIIINEKFKASVYEAGCILPYIAYQKDHNKECVLPETYLLCNAILDMFEKTGRIVLDAIAPGNFVTRLSDGKVICIDAGFALRFDVSKKNNREKILFVDEKATHQITGFENDDAFEKSVTSLSVWPKKASLYIDYFNQYNQKIGTPYYFIITFIKALIVLATLNLELKTTDVLRPTKNWPSNLLDPQWEFIMELAALFDSKTPDLKLPQSHLFKKSAGAALQEHNKRIWSLILKSPLSPQEIQWARLNPMSPFIYWFSYLKVDAKIRHHFITKPCYQLSTDTFYLLADFVLDGNMDKWSEFSTYYDNNTRLGATPSKGERFHALLALISLIENLPADQKTLTDSAKTARDELHGLNFSEIKLLVAGFQYGLRGKHLPLPIDNSDISNERHQMIMRALENRLRLPEAIQDKFEIKTLAKASDAELSKIIAKMNQHLLQTRLPEKIESSSSADLNQLWCGLGLTPSDEASPPRDHSVASPSPHRCPSTFFRNLQQRDPAPESPNACFLRVLQENAL
ncbi:MAG: hypothetical protein NTZ67_03815 [Gammaproteobacteria bacterium]|nr:hypothetical protein [Gammaproteobacteria bacterium]